VFFTNGGTEAIENAIRLAKGTPAVEGAVDVPQLPRATMGRSRSPASARRLDNEPGMPGAVKFFGPY
jgi:taurine--2-oxoglutarate transaminase